MQISSDFMVICIYNLVSKCKICYWDTVLLFDNHNRVQIFRDVIFTLFVVNMSSVLFLWQKFCLH